MPQWELRTILLHKGSFEYTKDSVEYYPEKRKENITEFMLFSPLPNLYSHLNVFLNLFFSLTRLMEYTYSFGDT